MKLIYADSKCPTCGEEINGWNPMTECKCCHRITCQRCNPRGTICCPSCKAMGMSLGREVMFV